MANHPNMLDRLKDRLLGALKKGERDRVAPPCSPSRTRSSSICSVALPDTRGIVKESLEQVDTEILFE